MSSSSCWLAWVNVALAVSFVTATTKHGSRLRSGGVLLAHARQEPEANFRSTASAQSSSLRLFDIQRSGGVGVCGKSISTAGNASSMRCPTECPFVRPDTARFCFFTCVAKEGCDNRNPLTSFADPVKHICSPCAVPGCLSCGKTRNQCVACNDYLTLTEDGKCISTYGHAWEYIYCAAGILLVFVLVYLICLFLRPNVNDLALRRAEAYRHCCKLFRKIGSTSLPYPLHTNLTRQNILGAGVQLHFSFMRYMIIWACVVTLAMFILSRIPVYSIYPAVGEDTHPNDRDVFKACEAAGSAKIRSEMQTADHIYLWFAFGIYVFSTIGSLFMFVQHRYLMRSDEDADQLRHYAVQACGFPECSGDQKLEEEYKEFFEKSFPDAKIIGVSIAWLASNSSMDVDKQVDQELDMLDRSRDDCLGIESETFESMASLSARGEQRRSGCLDPSSGLRCADNILLGCPCCMTEADNCLEEADLSNELSKLTSSGIVFVVFQTGAQRDKACAQKSLKYGDSVISLKQLWNDPETSLWNNYHKRFTEQFLEETKAHALELGLKCVACGIGLFIAVTLWSSLAYQPATSYLLSWNSAPGMTRLHWWDEAVQAALLSLPIIISNQLLYAVCDVLSQWIRFTTKGGQNLAYVVMYTVFVTYQTVLDIYIVIQTAYGHQTEDSWKLAQASGVLGSKAIAQNPTIRDTLYVEMVSYLYPGTLLVPYLMEPLGLGIAQYFIFKWLIRSRPDVRIQAAENMLVAMPYDMTRYGDILISVICCILVCFIASPDVWQVFAYLTCMLVFCYCWDHYRVLRLCPRSWMDDNAMDDFCIMMLSVPCACLAAAVVFRKYGAHNDPNLSRDSVPVWCFFAFFLHLAFHMASYLLILARINVTESAAEGSEDKHPCYPNVAGETAYNWFNTNYVHCLRSKYIYKDGPAWCIPAKLGREYLLRRNAKLGLYYEAEQTLQEASAREDLKDLAGMAMTKAQDAGHKLQDAGHSAGHTLQDAGHKLQDAGHSAGHTLQDAGQKLQDAGHSALTAGHTLTQAAARRVSNTGASESPDEDGFKADSEPSEV